MRRGNSKNYVSVPKGLAAGAMPMRSVAWRLCRRDWKVLSWRSRLLRWRPGTRTSSWCLMRSGIWRVWQLKVVTGEEEGLAEAGTESTQRVRCQSGGLAKRQSRQETCGDEALVLLRIVRSGASRYVYTSKNVMMTNQRRRKNKLSASEYSDVEVPARLLLKVGES